MKLHRKRLYPWAIGAVLVAIAIVLSASAIWYNWQLAPVQDERALRQFVVEPGQGPSAIAENLQTDGFIRSSAAFQLYMRLHTLSDIVQAGTYRLSPDQSSQEIAEVITSGMVEEFSVTFIPGETLAKHTEKLRDAGFSAQEVQQAYRDVRDHELLKSLPRNKDLEGYIYGETYAFASGATATEVVERTLDTYYAKLTESDLLKDFKKQGLSLHEAITLASIVQREMTNSNPSELTRDQQIVAQIFYSRLKANDRLGADATYQYIADKLGEERSIDFDSPYNTRRYPGLPPGPIASPGLGALKAVGNPANTNYYYFVSGDDEKTYFSRTNEEHERNVREHCHEKCQII